MQLTQRTRFRMLFSLPIPTCTSSEGRHRSLLGFTTIMLNCARLQLRRRAKHVQVSLDESTGGPQPVSVSERLADHRPNPEDEYRKSELSTRLTHLHSQLSPTLRRTFQFRDVDGLSIRVTAQILGVPTGTVKAQSAHGRHNRSYEHTYELQCQLRIVCRRLLEEHA